MKLVRLAKHGALDARDFLITIVESSPGGQTIGEMRKRLAVVKKLRAADGDTVKLEDDEHTTLLAVLDGRDDFAVTSEDILSIYDAVQDAKPA